MCFLLLVLGSWFLVLGSWFLVLRTSHFYFVIRNSYFVLACCVACRVRLDLNACNFSRSCFRVSLLDTMLCFHLTEHRWVAALGEHPREVLQDVGYDDSEITRIG